MKLSRLLIMSFIICDPTRGLHALLRLVIRCTVRLYNRLEIKQPYCLSSVWSIFDLVTPNIKSLLVGMVTRKYFDMSLIILKTWGQL